jgi:hypothetical protein
MREQKRDRQYVHAPPASVNSAEGDAKAAEEDGAELTVEEKESKEKELQTSRATEKLDKEQALILNLKEKEAKRQMQAQALAAKNALEYRK